jgi:hypothetical protein
MGRQWWVFWRDGFGAWLATPREDLDPAELEAARAMSATPTAARNSSCVRT